MHRVLPVSKQPRMHAGKQPHAFASNGSKTLKTAELTNRMKAEQNKANFFHSVNAEFNEANTRRRKISEAQAEILRRLFFYLSSSFPLRYSGNRFHFKQRRLLNGADPICLRLSFLSEHPPKTLPTKGCLSARNFPHSLQRQTFFSSTKGPSANSP